MARAFLALTVLTFINACSNSDSAPRDASPEVAVDAAADVVLDRCDEQRRVENDRLTDARRCDPDATTPQCTEYVAVPHFPPGISGFCCQLAVNHESTTEIEAYKAARLKNNCGGFCSQNGCRVAPPPFCNRSDKLCYGYLP